MTFSYRHRKLIVLSAIFLLALISSIFIFSKHFRKSKSVKERKVVLVSKKQEVKASSEDNATYYLVDIKGEVNNPGTYSMKAGSRVIDVIHLAGDLKNDADTSVLNLSKKIKD